MHRQQQRTIRVRSPDPSLRDDPQPFSLQIMDEPIPPHFLTPKITPFSRVEDLETHLKARLRWALTQAQFTKYTLFYLIFVIEAQSEPYLFT